MQRSPGRVALVMAATDKARQKAEAWHRAFAALGDCSGLSLAQQANLGARMGASARTVRRLWLTWCREGRDAAALIDRRLSPDRGSLAVTSEFATYWKELCELNQRSSKAAYRAFLRAWTSGELIPGIPSELARGAKPPRGFSYANLMRHGSSPLERVAARIGRQAAANYRPLVYTTRVGMQVGQEIMFDDVWHDFMVVQLGQRKPCRLLQLHAHDVFSACQFARGIKPRIEDPESGSSVGLEAGDMLFLLAHVLGSFGYHPDGTRLLLENGTATVDSATAALLSDLSESRVRCAFADIQSQAAWAGQYAGRGKGNFRFKASIESSHNLIHNETAGMLDLPGQTGANSRISAPEQLHGQMRAMDALQRAMVGLPEDVRAQLRMPFVESTRAIMALNEVQERINRRTEHELEGWVEAGLTTIEWEMGGAVIPAERVAALSAEQQVMLATVASPVPRRLSPREVFDSGRKRLIRFRPELTARLLVGVCGREVVVRPDHQIHLEDASISPSTLRFLAHDRAPGDKYRAVVNPYSPEQAHLFDAANRWCGIAKLWQSVPRVDAAAVRERISEASEIANLLMQPLARTGRAMERRLSDAEHNAGVLALHAQQQTDLGDAADSALQNLT